MASDLAIQQCLAAFYKENGPCCAGCDHWRFHNAVLGDCIKTVPVSSNERLGMQDIHALSLEMPSGHIVTDRDHYCGDFIDSTNNQ